jgi:hypothetical protein
VIPRQSGCKAIATYSRRPVFSLNSDSPSITCGEYLLTS